MRTSISNNATYATRVLYEPESVAAALAKVYFFSSHQGIASSPRRNWQAKALSPEEVTMLAYIRQVPIIRVPELKEKLRELVEDVLDEEEDKRDLARRRALTQRARAQQDDVEL